MKNWKKYMFLGCQCRWCLIAKYERYKRYCYYTKKSLYLLWIKKPDKMFECHCCGSWVFLTGNISQCSNMLPIIFMHIKVVYFNNFDKYVVWKSISFHYSINSEWIISKAVVKRHMVYYEISTPLCYGMATMSNIDMTYPLTAGWYQFAPHRLSH